MNIQQLRFAVATSETLSFHRAAPVLFTSRQNVSRTIRSLENELGILIFNRQGNNLTLTEDGRCFVERAKETLNSFDVLQKDFTRSSDVVKDLDFAFDIGFFTNNADNYYLMKTIDDYAKTPNGCRIRILENLSTFCYEQVLRHNVDLCLILGMPRSFPDCEVVELLNWPLGVMVGKNHPLADKGYFELEDFAGQDILAPPGFEFKYMPLVQECHAAGIDFRPFRIINEGWEAVESVRSADGVIVADYREDSAARKKGSLILPLKCEENRAGLYLIYRKDSPRSGRIAHFISYLEKNNAWMNQCLYTGFERFTKDASSEE